MTGSGPDLSPLLQWVSLKMRRLFVLLFTKPSIIANTHNARRSTAMAVALFSLWLKCVMLWFALKLYRKCLSSYVHFRVSRSRFQPKIIIIGGGFSGLCMAYHLKHKLQYDAFEIYESRGEVGGTWSVNTYPGCCCDIDGYFYSFSFELNPFMTRAYPTQAETLAYMRYFCRKYDLYSHIRFNTTVTKMEYNASTKLWTLHSTRTRTRTQTGTRNASNRDSDEIVTEVSVANIVISGVGQLSKKNIPVFKNRERFAGQSFHSSDWNHAFAARGARVGVIGTAPSAVQIIPALMKANPKQLVVFQRSASHCLPKFDAKISPIKRSALNYVPLYHSLIRFYSYFRNDVQFYPATYNMRYNKLLCDYVYTPYKDAVFKNDKQLNAKITPPEYQPMITKRVLVSADYYPTLTAPNVQVITNPIHSFSENGIMIDVSKDYKAMELQLQLRNKNEKGNEHDNDGQNHRNESELEMKVTYADSNQPRIADTDICIDIDTKAEPVSNKHHNGMDVGTDMDMDMEMDMDMDIGPAVPLQSVHSDNDGEQKSNHLSNIELDCVVFATGFQSQNFLGTIAEGVIGVNGTHLRRDAWQYSNASAYLGICVSDFPNLFLLYGPGTNLGTGSIIFMIECASQYITECVSKMIREEWTEMEVKREEMRKHLAMVDERHRHAVWSVRGVRNWYKNYNGRVPSNWPFSMAYYWWATKKPNWDHFNIA